MDEISWQALGGIAGASVAAGIVVQAVKVYVPLTPAGARKVALAVGFLVVMGFTTVTNLGGDRTPAEWAALAATGALVGLQAGLAASKAYEVRRDGLAHSTTPLPPGDHDTR